MKEKIKQLTFPWTSNYDSSINSFYVQKNNKLLINNLIDESNNEDILIFGSESSGKSYLLQALSNHYAAKGKSSTYIPLGKIIHLDESIFDSLQYLDLICIDELNLIQDDIKWQKSLFNLLNNSINFECKIIFAATAVNTLSFSMKDFDSRLRRLDYFELNNIKDENLLDALRHISKVRSINLGNKESNFLINHTKRDIKSLVKLIEDLDQLSVEAKKRITIAMIKEII